MAGALRHGSHELVGICLGRGFHLCGLSRRELRDGNRLPVSSGGHSYQEGISLGLALGTRCCHNYELMCAGMGLLYPWSPNASSSLAGRGLHQPYAPASLQMAICSSPGCSSALLLDEEAASATAYKIDSHPAYLNASASYSNFPTSASVAGWRDQYSKYSASCTATPDSLDLVRRGHSTSTQA